MAVTALAPTIAGLRRSASSRIGVASGTFLAVDWALMTDIIPKAASGRYMGISNIAVVPAGPFASVIGGALLFVVGGAVRSGDGPRAAFAAAIALFVLAAFFLRRVDARPREEPLPRRGRRRRGRLIRRSRSPARDRRVMATSRTAVR